MKKRRASTLANTPAKDSPAPDIQADSAADTPENPATNLLAGEILLRMAGHLARNNVEKTLLSRRFEPAKAKAIVDDRSWLHTLAAYGVTRVATRSLPGAILVGGGLVAKALYDRGQARRSARKVKKNLKD